MLGLGTVKQQITTDMQTIFDFTALDSQGREHALEQYRGQVLLIVNTASKCGFTPQYAQLEELYRKYKDRGLVVLGFPCDQFAHQEPGSDEQIRSFCQINYGVSFPIMQKVLVNGEEASPIFRWLRTQAGGWFGNRIKWNFTKFLISRDGLEVKRYSPIRKPLSFAEDIERMLG